MEKQILKVKKTTLLILFGEWFVIIAVAEHGVMKMDLDMKIIREKKRRLENGITEHEYPENHKQTAIRFDCKRLYL